MFWCLWFHERLASQKRFCTGGYTEVTQFSRDTPFVVNFFQLATGKVAIHALDDRLQAEAALTGQKALRAAAWCRLPVDRRCYEGVDARRWYIL